MAGNYPKTSIIPSSEWEKIKTAFTQFRKVNKNEDIQVDFIWNNIPIGEILENIRQLRCEEKLTHEQMRFFERLDIDLQYRERHWYYMYRKAKQYYEIYGYLSVSKKEDYTLQKWIASQRQKYYGAPRKRKNRMDKYPPLSERQKRLLEDIEIIWDTSTTWTKYFPLLNKYYQEMHDTNVPSTFFIGHLNLGYWVNRLRKGLLRITAEQRQCLDNIKFEWDTRSIASTSFPEQATLFYFSFWYTDAVSRYKLNGEELDIFSPSWKIAIEYDGYAWHKDKEKIDRDNKKDKLCKVNKIKLIRIREEGLPQTKYAKNYFMPLPFSTDNFDKVIRDIYANEFGNPLVNINTREHGFEILRRYRKLEDMAFYKHLEELKEYIKEHHCFPSIKPPRSSLSNWILSLRQIRRGLAHGVLTNEQIKDLDELGFVWDPYEEKLNNIFIHLKLYVEKGNDYLPSSYVDPVDKFKLGVKIGHLRQKGPYGKSYGGKRLTDEQIRKFDELGMNWVPDEPFLKTKK